MSKVPIDIMPRPLRQQAGSGEFCLTAGTVIRYCGEATEDLALLLAEYLRPVTGFSLTIEPGDDPTGALLLEQTGGANPDEAGFCDESYTLEVTSSGVRIRALTDYGVARGIQTLRQLFPPAVFSAAPGAGPWTVPAVSIEDRPQYRWRGLHLDVCRHFFSREDVCRFIDLLALHRMNMCHLHLTEDQGWRIEIKAYPKLTEVGSKRTETVIGHERDRPRRYDGTPYGGFFTQEDIRTIVAFARQRRVNLVPEIDMPGHMQAAVASYPELGVTGESVEVRGHYGISSDILNVEEETVRFMRTVLDEVIDLFPGRFIHVGGDEAKKDRWGESKRVQQRMREVGAANEEELQSWFIRRMEEHIVSRGRRLIGWDEILQGGLAPQATVMSWRGEEGGISAAKEGHDVVMAPSSHLYFDHYQAEPIEEEPLAIGGMTTLGRAYSYDPLSGEIPADKQHHVMGCQGQLWTEYIPDRDQLDYMTYPRACALAELTWLPREEKSFADFRRRLAFHRRRLQAYGVKACSRD